MAKTRRNFKTKAHLACSKSEAQVSMNYIIFEDNNLVAVDGHIILVQSLYGHGFTSEEVDILEGKALHRETFQEVLRYDTIKVTDKGIEANKGKTNVIFPLETLQQQCDYNYVNYKSLVPDLSNVTDLTSIGFDLNILSRIKDLTLNPDSKVEFNFFGKHKVCVINGVGCDENIIIMPIKVES